MVFPWKNSTGKEPLAKSMESSTESTGMIVLFHDDVRTHLQCDKRMKQRTNNCLLSRRRDLLFISLVRSEIELLKQ